MKGSAAAVTSCSLNVWRMATLDMLHSKLSCARGQAEGERSAGVSEEPDPTVYTRSPSSRAKEMFREKNKDTVYPPKHIWKRIKEQSLDDRRVLETRSDVSL